MKFFLVLALIAAVASAQSLIKPKDLHGLTESQMAEVMEILEAIHSPSTDPTTAAMLENMLYEILGIKPPTLLPALVDDEHLTPIHVPGIVDDEYVSPIHIPGIIDDDQVNPIHIPGIVDFPIPEGAIVPTPVAPSSPLVQIIVNVNQRQSDSEVHEIERPMPAEVEEMEIEPTPVEIVEDIDQVQVVDEAEVESEPVNIAPIIVAPAVVEPETLN